MPVYPIQGGKGIDPVPLREAAGKKKQKSP